MGTGYSVPSSKLLTSPASVGVDRAACPRSLASPVAYPDLGMIKKINIEGYRSIRNLSLDLQPINVLTGPNGCGKSNLYNSLVLIARAAEGRLARAIAEEGGTPSVFGPVASASGCSVSVRLGAS